MKFIFCIATVLLCNGIYDILCALFIVMNETHFMAKHHFNCFVCSDLSNSTKRYFAYWIFNYGFIHLFCSYVIILSIIRNSILNKSVLYSASISYAIEALIFEMESCFSKLIIWKVHTISLSSMAIAAIILIPITND